MSKCDALTDQDIDAMTDAVADLIEVIASHPGQMREVSSQTMLTLLPVLKDARTRVDNCPVCRFGPGDDYYSDWE